ncbi:MAG: DUF3990 domain-containing protein [Synergistaceae bacterium]|jgi:hypothetical protein|nr:DUF3990 domain-containing protein [Synergistaceae bacterium]
MLMLYHGSYLAVRKPDISYSRDNTDFGKGFYTTPIKEQAVKWSERFKRRNGQGVVSRYAFDDVAAKTKASIWEFEYYSDEWLDFIIACRGGEVSGNYDVIIGGVANDKVFNTIQLFLDELIDKGEALKRLKYEEPNLQYCFRNQRVIDEYLQFASSEAL